MYKKEIIPITAMKNWATDEDLEDFCKKIINQAERYEPGRVAEAREILKNIKKKTVNPNKS